jgi:transaldolase
MSYFHDVSTQFGTELWINNPSLSEINLGLLAGAVGIASNPLYIAALLKSEPEFVRETIDEAVRDTGGKDDEQLAMAVIRKAVSRPLKMFHRLFEETRGRHGYVAIQGNPFKNDDLTALLNEAEEFRNLGENVIIKLPATVEGAQALEELTARGWSTIGTMSFSVDQYIHMAEAHRRGLQRTTQQPRCLITMLPGMFDDYLAENAGQRGIEMSEEVRCQAGIATARAACQVWRERNYEAGILSGGASSTTHWTDLVGHGMAMTLSGKLTEALVKQPPPVKSLIETSAPHQVIEELRGQFPDFVGACDEGALAPESFRNYGPVVRFQKSLAGGLEIIMREIRNRQ